MPLVSKAPVNVPLFTGNRQLSTAWQLWFESVDRRIGEVQGGGSVGDILGDSNTGFTISSTANIYINGLLITNPPGEGYVALANSTELSWISPEELAAIPTGVIRPMIDSSIPDGWVLLDDGTIGSASSGASNRANADCEDLFLHIWNNISNTNAPVTGGRGASAAADWAANKKIQLGWFAGRGLKVMGGSGTIGAKNGAETTTMAENQLPDHHHYYTTIETGSGNTSDPIRPGWLINTSVTGVISYSGDWTNYTGTTWYTTNSDNWAVSKLSGDNNSQNIIQETVFFKHMIKL